MHTIRFLPCFSAIFEEVKKEVGEAFQMEEEPYDNEKNSAKGIRERTKHGDPFAVINTSKAAPVDSNCLYLDSELK